MYSLFQFKMFKMKMKQTFGDVESDTESNMKNRSKVIAVIVVESLIFTAFFTSIFLLLPAAIFTVLENDENNSWSYFDSIYFTFVTLSTIGFGDMVPGTVDRRVLCNGYGAMIDILIFYSRQAAK